MAHNKPSNSCPKPLIISLIFSSISLTFLASTLKPKFQLTDDTFSRHHHPTNINSKWFDLLAPNIHGGKIKIGLVNVDDNMRQAYTHMAGRLEAVNVDFQNVSTKLKWGDFFPLSIDEDEKWGPPSCPEIPLPRLEEYGGLNFIVAGVPCGARGTENKGIRDVFRCDDLLTHAGDYWVYKPNLWKLKEKVLMPAGSCQIAPLHAETRKYSQSSPAIERSPSSRHKRVAYATVLHSSEAYVCGAIALAQSILQSNSTHDPILLHDSSLSPNSLQGLRDAGWKPRLIQPIRSPFAQNGSYNEWNYSKLRTWQLTEYDKVIFVDADLIVLKNINKFFNYPQLSAAPNDQVIFNSGIMVIEPSTCMFEDLRSKSHKLVSYNGGDQGYLNEVFTWWHRLPFRLNYLKISKRPKEKGNNYIREDIYAIHFLGLKPWACYKDYDCNWDMVDRHIFASDSAHKKWWQVHDAMPKKLQQYCALTRKMDERIKKWRGIAKDTELPNGHWKIEVRDPRQYHLVE
ncbi:hypothetical protein Tsubulata_030033 [Turnera subulata]|uniref:Hexosyltransferase n=1 Tax=Turnera subulata TaxID=218843 RepID=A0A9Q0G4A6_9ROSI|nr:hypothetical protein Tsubulata_030033 [Turnera subulata]